jgi:hypothetical protein
VHVPENAAGVPLSVSHVGDVCLHDETFLGANFLLKINSVCGSRFHESIGRDSSVNVLKFGE